MLPPEPFVLAANDWVAVATTRTPARRAATNTERLICPDPLPSAKVGGEPPARLRRYTHYERAGRLDCPAVRTVRTTSAGTAESARRSEARREKPATPSYPSPQRDCTRGHLTALGPADGADAARPGLGPDRGRPRAPRLPPACSLALAGS